MWIEEYVAERLNIEEGTSNNGRLTSGVCTDAMAKVCVSQATQVVAVPNLGFQRDTLEPTARFHLPPKFVHSRNLSSKAEGHDEI